MPLRTILCDNHEFMNGVKTYRKARKTSKLMQGLGVLTSPSIENIVPLLKYRSEILEF